MTAILIGQFVIPLLLVLAFVAFPPRSTAAWGTQLLSSLLALMALAHIGIWLFPPWWTPHVAAVVLLLAAVIQVLRRPFDHRLPDNPVRWAITGLFGVVGVAAIALIVTARLAARPPDDIAPVAIDFPLGAGNYLVVNGGDHVLINAHQESLDTSIARLRAWRGNGHAVDIVGINAAGFRAAGFMPENPERYEIFGAPVVAPCSGTVVNAVNDLPDMPVPRYDREHLAGNHVLLECVGVHIVLAHLRRGSVRVRPGDAISTGKVVGAVGNSGGTNEPHLHIHAQRAGPGDRPFAGDPIPLLMGGRFLVRGDRVTMVR